MCPQHGLREGVSTIPGHESTLPWCPPVLFETAAGSAVTWKKSNIEQWGERKLPWVQLWHFQGGSCSGLCPGWAGSREGALWGPCPALGWSSVGRWVLHWLLVLFQSLPARLSVVN